MVTLLFFWYFFLSAIITAPLWHSSAYPFFLSAIPAPLWHTSAYLLLYCCTAVALLSYTLRVHGVFADVIFLMCAVLYYYCSCCRIGSRLCLRGRGLHLLSIFFLLLYRPRAGKVQRTTSVVLCINTTTCCATLLRRWRVMCVRLLPRRSCLLSYHKHHHVLPGI